MNEGFKMRNVHDSLQDMITDCALQTSTTLSHIFKLRFYDNLILSHFKNMKQNSIDKTMNTINSSQMFGSHLLSLLQCDF